MSEQKRIRIKLALAAFAYEMCGESIMSDAEFDKMCKQVDTNMLTGNDKMDSFFKEHFNASTGQWIHRHPELDKISSLYYRFYAKSREHLLHEKESKL